MRLAVSDFHEWTTRAANVLAIEGGPARRLSLATFRMRKLPLPERLQVQLEAITQDVDDIGETQPLDEDGFDEYVSDCCDQADNLDQVMASIVAGRDAFGIGGEDVAACEEEIKRVRQAITVMAKTPKATIAVIESLVSPPTIASAPPPSPPPPSPL